VPEMKKCHSDFILRYPQYVICSPHPYCAGDKIEKNGMGWAGHVACMGEERGCIVS